MAGSRSTDGYRAGQIGRRLRRGIAGLDANERAAAIGVVVVCGSLLLPWYGVPVAGDLVQTGLGAFSFAEAALLLTVGATLFMLLSVGQGYRLPRPLSVGALMIAAGAWASLIVCFRLFDRPDFELVAGTDDRTRLRYGIFVALAGAMTILFTGLRAQEMSHRRGVRPPPG